MKKENEEKPFFFHLVKGEEFEEINRCEEFINLALSNYTHKCIVASFLLSKQRTKNEKILLYYYLVGDINGNLYDDVLFTFPKEEDLKSFLEDYIVTRSFERLHSEMEELEVYE